MAATVTIEKRFCGPPDSGNGGYVGGLLARHYRPDCQVTLLAPPPLDTSLVLAVDAAEARLSRGADTLAVARPFTLELAVPAAPTLEEARAAQCRYAGFVEHSLPTCFVCGPEREPNDGLLISPGRWTMPGWRRLGSRMPVWPMSAAGCYPSLSGRRWTARAILPCRPRPDWRYSAAWRSTSGWRWPRAIS